MTTHKQESFQLGKKYFGHDWKAHGKEYTIKIAMLRLMEFNDPHSDWLPEISDGYFAAVKESGWWDEVIAAAAKARLEI